MKAIILVAQGVEDVEFWYPYYRLQEAGFDIDVVVSGYSDIVVSGYLNITGKYGIPIKNIHLTSQSLPNMCKSNSKEPNLIIVPGGWQAPEIMRQDKNILDFLRYHNHYNQQKRTIIGTICHGSQVLISAGIVQGKRMTCYKGMKDDLINAGAKYVNVPVVIDENIVSAQHYDNNPEWMKAILANV